MVKRKSVCWISSARYSRPLGAMDAGKWALLAGLEDYDIRVVGFSTSLRPRRFCEHVRFYLLPQASFAPLRYLTFFALGPPLLLWLTCRHGCEILVAQSPFEGAVGAWVKGVAGVFGIETKLIIENHNNFEEDVFLQRSMPFKGLYRKMMLGLARYAFARGDAARVISTSTSERARVYAPHLPQARFMTWSESGIFERARRGVAVGEAVDIVYAGVLIPRKGVHLLLEAFAGLGHSRARLHLVGEPENADYAESLREQAGALGIGERVHFAGAVSQGELAEYFGGARVMVLPSLSEGLGRVLVEAMLMGTPVIGSRVGGIPDLIRDGENGYLFEAGDVEGLRGALERIYGADVAAMGERGRELAREFFSPERYLDGYRRLFALVSDGESSG